MTVILVHTVTGLEFLVIYTFLLLPALLRSNSFIMVTANRVDRWGMETLGGESLSEDMPQSQAEIHTYKQNLLQYVLQTDEPKQVLHSGSMPYVMDKIYDLLADKSTGKQKRSAPFEVDLIRGLEDHRALSRRMEFWFNVSSINDTEDIIECSFHIYKKRPQRIPTTMRQKRDTHSISINLYKIVDETNMFSATGEPASGVELIERQHVSAYTSQWIVFKSNIKDSLKQWVRHPHKNKGLLLTATDTDNTHVNGTHIEFSQKGELPSSQQPLFVVYTDQEKKKNKKNRKRHRKNINYLIDNFLNEDSRRVEQQRSDRCNSQLIGDMSFPAELCMELLLRHRRSLIDETINIDDEIETLSKQGEVIQTEPDGAQLRDRGRRRQKRRHGKDFYFSANTRDQQTEFCRVKPLYINFEALGWGRWIVAPDGLNANYCDGTCPFPLTSSLTASNHAVLQSVSNYYHPSKIKPPCCVPQKLARMSILYYQDETTVTMRNYDNMIVESCGCR